MGVWSVQQHVGSDIAMSSLAMGPCNLGPQHVIPPHHAPMHMKNMVFSAAALYNYSIRSL